MRIVAYLAVTVLSGLFLYGLNASLDSPAAPHARLLLMSDVVGSNWERTLAGARAAAQDLGIALDIQTTPVGTDSPLRAAAQNFDSTAYDGVALAMADAESNRNLIDDLGDRTKLVTIGNDCAGTQKTRRLCHIGCRQTNVGGMVARFVRLELARHGKIALLVSQASDLTASTGFADRLEGFKEEWLSQNQVNADSICPIVQAAIDTSTFETASQSLSVILNDADLTCIIAFDASSAESAVKVLAAMPKSRRLPLIALDTSRAILDAIADGGIHTAIYHDPFRDGYTAIERLNSYCHTDVDGLPKPGYGSFSIVPEVVRQDNLASFRPARWVVR